MFLYLPPLGMLYTFGGATVGCPVGRVTYRPFNNLTAVFWRLAAERPVDEKPLAIFVVVVDGGGRDTGGVVSCVRFCVKPSRFVSVNLAYRDVCLKFVLVMVFC